MFARPWIALLLLLSPLVCPAQELRFLHFPLEIQAKLGHRIEKAEALRKEYGTIHQAHRLRPQDLDTLKALEDMTRRRTEALLAVAVGTHRILFAKQDPLVPDAQLGQALSLGMGQSDGMMRAAQQFRFLLNESPEEEQRRILLQCERIRRHAMERCLELIARMVEVSRKGSS